eukprot:CAMPEP_0114552308 /NCGR_PEP_ID=MMETSP0114-20121206/7058_1 /TAXON_ID=31324 /ORGANISM="Goniomonas sp, Strain m" /LENGTH=278 /DNA_ID=CAMNT_0001737181 /DNA_START=99 /DNA_END=935 /DNA_ORIENTATION=-
MNARVMTPKVADKVEPKLPEEKSGSVGVILVDAEQGPFHGRVAVLTLVEGGPAEIDGRIHPGDLIVSVNGRNVKDWGVESIRLLVHGRVGSVALLGFERPSTQTKFCVALRRASVQSMEKHEHDLERQLHEAQAALHKETMAHTQAERRADAEEHELERLKQRLSAARIEKDKLVASHSHEMGDVLEELLCLEDELRDARAEATQEASLRKEAEKLVQHTKQELLETRLALEDEIEAAVSEAARERALRFDAVREAQHAAQQLQQNRWNPACLHGVQI